MSRATFSHHILRNAVALSAVFGAAAVLSAQSTIQTSQAPSTIPAAEVSLQVPALDTSKDVLFSSSATENADAPVAEASLAPMTPNFAEMMQYGGRARAGRPRYRGANTNPDGSNKWTGYAGFGFQQPVGNTYKYFTPGWALQVGFGRQYSRHFAIPIEFDWDSMSLSKSALGNESYIYTFIANGVGDPVASDNGIDANAHVWSFSIDPRFTFAGSDKASWGAYVLADVGFYHKVTNFTAPELETVCTYFCYSGYVQSNFDHYTSNAPGFGAGFGVTYKFSRFSNERFYGEARYVFIDNSQRYGYTVQNAEAGNTTYAGSNFFPANSNRTTYFPVKFGIQF